ncbi:LOW QUALITY PROTEIN: Helitron helicase-like protein [Phytophthora palmivora]|uniref:Helitron helicase-like protein n=1 Tax=Phytophthora palmivora TaxID=4796 RepID=A0A2P4Y6F4_9STRA|nr:LOW QUALITY PROTEIN: Helitron helicase-like protein [Phytophthora palmivora]
MPDEDRQTIRDEDAAARRATRDAMTEEEERQTMRNEDTAARRATRETMTEEERQSKKNLIGEERQSDFDAGLESTKKGLRTTKSSTHLPFPAAVIISPDTRTIPWSTSESVSTAELGNFPTKPKEVVVGLVTVPPPREAPAELSRLFGNPRFKQSIRAYNNVFAFTSMGSSRTRSLNVDERVTRSGVYNFRVQGRMGALLPPLNRRPMFAQVYINDPDMEARVASRMGMTDGLDPAILEKIDQVMTAHNGYTQQFLNARRILIDRAGPAYQAAVEQFARELVTGEARPGDNPALRLNEFLPRDEDLRLRLHVARNANPGTHNVPTASEVAAIIIDRAAAEHRDIILNTRQGGFKRIYETSESYDPLQYPLLFPYGEPG